MDSRTVIFVECPRTRAKDRSLGLFFPAAPKACLEEVGSVALDLPASVAALCFVWERTWRQNVPSCGRITKNVITRGTS